MFEFCGTKPSKGGAIIRYPSCKVATSPTIPTIKPMPRPLIGLRPSAVAANKATAASAERRSKFEACGMPNHASLVSPSNT
jgi:hypothetical protein